MIMDKKGRLFGRFSIVDLIIVVVVLAAVAGIGYKFTKSNTATPFTKLDDLEIVFYQEEAPEYAAVAVKKGDIAKDSIQGSLLGNVTSVKVDKSVSWGVDAAGKFVSSPKQGYSSIYVTIDGKGLYGTNGVTIENSQYFIGRYTEVKIGNAAFAGRLYDIRKKD